MTNKSWVTCNGREKHTFHKEREKMIEIGVVEKTRFYKK